MDQCPKCGRFFLRYEPRLGGASCTNSECRYVQGLSEAEYHIRFSKTILPQTTDARGPHGRTIASASQLRS